MDEQQIILLLCKNSSLHKTYMMCRTIYTKQKLNYSLLSQCAINWI